jgi:NAD(P)-dependent dehydrogenase (short-subunit alcohol dehydrogenase family)
VAREIRGRVVAITGASSGIGLALALRLAARGAKLVLGARREDRLREAAERCRALGAPEAIAWRTDVTVPRDLELLCGAAVEQLGRLDVLVNNAGRGHVEPLAELPLERLREQMETNFFSAFHGARAALPIMRAQGSGHIIFVTSVLQKRGVPYMAPYCAAKAATGSLAESLRLELRGSGIAVTTIVPGSTATEFNAATSGIQGKGPTGPVRPADHVARTIERAIRRPRPEAYPARLERALAIANEVAPRLVDLALVPVLKRFRALDEAAKRAP